MRFVTSKTNVEIKYKKISTSNLVPYPQIIMKHQGKKVSKIRVDDKGNVLEGFHWKTLREDGSEVSAKEIEYFIAKEDGTESQVRPFERTKEIRVVKEIPASSMNGFLIESQYELYHKEESAIQALYEEAERYQKEDLIGIALFSWGHGFKQYYAIIHPIMRDGKFVWIMQLTQTKLEYQNMMEIPATVKIPIVQPPTISNLPPVEQILVVA